MTNTLEATIPKLSALAACYSELLEKNGPNAAAVAWRDPDEQLLRFEVLLQIIGSQDLHRGGIVINDLGCGYGALFDYLKDDSVMKNSRYQGYDICEALVEEAKRQTKDKRAHFTQSMVATEAADFSFVSGTFNMVVDDDGNAWRDYIKDSIAHLWQQTRKGLAFNMLDAAQTPPDEQSSGLFYDTALPYIDFCARLGAKVTLIDDYPLKEWTLFLRR